MQDVAKDITLLPPQFVAHGVEFNGGIYNKPFSPGFTFADVDDAMDGATVVMLNAGFAAPKLAAVSLAMLEASQLPIWLNVYLSKPGLVRSTQLHTDKQDVLLVQCSGRKRWRVYRPPPPAETPQHDPFARGKGTDMMTARTEDLLIDTVMAPGQVLYIPAGFPHETDTVGEVSQPSALAAANEPSVHLTVGIDTHLWGLSYAKMREAALSRAQLSAGIPSTSLALSLWLQLHTPLPLGFLAAPLLQSLCSDGLAATVSLAEARGALCRGMASELACVMRLAEPTRWDTDDDDSLVGELGLLEVAERFVAHHHEVLAIQTRMYRRVAAPASGVPLDGTRVSAKEQKALLAALFEDMDRLDEEMARLDRWAAGEEVSEEAHGKSGGFGGGSSGLGGVTKKSKAKGKGGKKGKRK